MAFQNLFSDLGGRPSSDAIEEEAGERAKPDSESSEAPGAGPVVDPVENEGPTHLPHRGLAPFKPQVTSPEAGPLHIPYRGLAPFRPARVGGDQNNSPSSVTSSPRKGRAIPGQIESAIAPPIPTPSQLKKQVSTPAQPATVHEVRDRPRESKRTLKPRVPRHSSGWAAMLKHFKDESHLRVLDIGPTSPTNINFLTAMGHSVYMADIVQEAQAGGWTRAGGELDAPASAVERFCEQNLNFQGRRFDVVLLWTTIDYLPEGLIPALISRIYESMEPCAQLLAFFHTRTAGADAPYCRYHLVDSSNIDMQENEPYPVVRAYTNREIEQLFKDFCGCKFFLARDNVYEVILTR